MSEKIAEATINLDVVESGEGGSSIVYQSTEPSASDYNAGDTWYKTDTDDNVVEVYAHDGTAWEQKEYTSTALNMTDVQDSLVRFGDSSGSHILINGGTLEFHTDETTFPVSIDADGMELGSSAQIGIITGGVEDTYLGAGILSSVGRAPSLEIKATATTGSSSINLEADEVLVNGSPIGGGSSCSARGTAGATSLSAGTITTVPLTTFIVNNDSDSFEIASSGIKCKKAGTVFISGGVYCGYNGTATAGVYIKKNSTEISSAYGVSNNIAGKTCAPVIIGVSAGDIIYLCARCSVAGQYYPNNSATHLDIMYL